MAIVEYPSSISFSTNIGGSFNSVQQMVRSDSVDDKIVTKLKELKNKDQTMCVDSSVDSFSKIIVNFPEI